MVGPGLLLVLTLALGGCLPPGRWRSLRDEGDRALHLKRYGEAERLLRQSLAEAETRPGRDSRRADSALLLAALFQEQGRFEEAERFQEEALRAEELRLGPSSPDLVPTVALLADFQALRGRYARAEPLYKRALALAEAGKSPEAESVSLRRAMALLCQAQGRLPEAEAHLRRSVAAAEAAFGPDSPELPGRLRELALLLQTAGRPADAETFYRRSLAAEERVRGKDDPALVPVLNTLALFLESRGNLPEAEGLYRRAVALGEKGPRAAGELAATLDNYSELLRKLGRDKESSSLAARARALRGK